MDYRRIAYRWIAEYKLTMNFEMKFRSHWSTGVDNCVRKLSIRNQHWTVKEVTSAYIDQHDDDRMLCYDRDLI